LSGNVVRPGPEALADPAETSQSAPDDTLGAAVEEAFGQDDNSADAESGAGEDSGESESLEIPDPDDWRSRLNLRNLVGRK
jgi:hypothetical protein